MKKLVALCLTLVLALSLSVSAFAANGAFISSPSANKAPELVNTDPAIKVTPYADRDDLADLDTEEMEEAYRQIANVIENNAFSQALKELAKELGKAASELSVSDLFHVNVEDATPDEQGGYTITIKLEDLENFIGLMQFNGTEWKNVEIISIDKENGTVTFRVTESGPIAVIVDNGTGSSTPPTGDNAMMYLGVCLVAAAGLVVVLVNSKKKRA